MATTIAAIIQIAVMIKTNSLKKGKIPKTRNKPGALANPRTRKSSFGFDWVCGSGRSFVPIQ
jgi:hypothetical protein